MGTRHLSLSLALSRSLSLSFSLSLTQTHGKFFRLCIGEDDLAFVTSLHFRLEIGDMEGSGAGLRGNARVT